jgi:hypothetical protein
MNLEDVWDNILTLPNSVSLCHMVYSFCTLFLTNLQFLLFFQGFPFGFKENEQELREIDGREKSHQNCDPKWKNMALG